MPKQDGWTVDPTTGRPNSSEDFFRIYNLVVNTIRTGRSYTDTMLSEEIVKVAIFTGQLVPKDSIDSSWAGTREALSPQANEIVHGVNRVVTGARRDFDCFDYHDGACQIVDNLAHLQGLVPMRLEYSITEILDGVLADSQIDDELTLLLGDFLGHGKLYGTGKAYLIVWKGRERTPRVILEGRVVGNTTRGQVTDRKGIFIGAYVRVQDLAGSEHDENAMLIKLKGS